MKKAKIDVCFFEPIVKLSAMFMIPSIACCRLPPPLFWTAKKWTLLKKDNAFLIWTGFILLFVNFQEIFFLSNHNIKKYVSKEKKRINRWVGYGLEIPTEYRFYGNERALNWAKTALDGVDGNVKKSCRCLKQSHFQKKSVTSYLCFIFFWPVGRYFSQW